MADHALTARRAVVIAATLDTKGPEIAFVRRLLEARGLDASPPIRAKLQSAGDVAGAAILDLMRLGSDLTRETGDAVGGRPHQAARAALARIDSCADQNDAGHALSRELKSLLRSD